MAATSSPYGLRPVQKLNGRDAGNIRSFPLSTNNTTGIFFGDLIHMASGVITAVGATPTTTQGSNTPVGVFVGCKFTDPVFGVRHSQYLPANSVNAGYTNIEVRYVDDPNAIFQVQADGQVPLTKVGQNAPLGNFGAGSTTTGDSAVQLVSASIATTNTLAVKIIDIVNSTAVDPAGSAPNDAYTDVLVVFNAGVHAYNNATGA